MTTAETSSISADSRSATRVMPSGSVQAPIQSDLGAVPVGLVEQDRGDHDDRGEHRGAHRPLRAGRLPSISVSPAPSSGRITGSGTSQVMRPPLFLGHLEVVLGVAAGQVVAVGGLVGRGEPADRAVLDVVLHVVVAGELPAAVGHGEQERGVPRLMTIAVSTSACGSGSLIAGRVALVRRSVPGRRGRRRSGTAC